MRILSTPPPTPRVMGQVDGRDGGSFFGFRRVRWGLTRGWMEALSFRFRAVGVGTLRFSDFRILEFSEFRIFAFWNSRSFGFSDFGVPGFAFQVSVGVGIFGVSDFEILGFSDSGIFGVSDFQILGFWDFRMLGFSDFRECWIFKCSNAFVLGWMMLRSLVNFKVCGACGGP